MCLLSITKEQSLGETGQSEKWGQGHSEAQVRQQIYYPGENHRRLCLETWFYRLWCSAFLFRWFEGFNWDGLCKGTLNPPVIPKVRHVQFGFLFSVLWYCLLQWIYFFLFFPISGERYFGQQYMWSLHRGLSGAVHELGWFLMDQLWTGKERNLSILHHFQV